MKLSTISILALLVASPALAQAVSEPDRDQMDNPAAKSSTEVTPPAQNPNVDQQTAAADTARQDMYQHKLDASKAQAKADSAIADRDAAQAQAEQDRADKDAAQDKEAALSQ